VAQRLIELLKPRLTAFIERFKAVVKAEPVVRKHTRAIDLTFAATVAKVTLLFEVFPDRDVNHVRLECTQEILPMLVRYNKQSVLEFPLGAVQDEALQEQLVEDPVARIRFPRYRAASTLQRNGRTYYFVDEVTRRAFEKRPATK
jgi:YHS domain-containing protein